MTRCDAPTIADLERQLKEERAQSDRFEKMLDEANAEYEALERQLAEARRLLVVGTHFAPYTDYDRRVREWLKANGGR